MPTIKKRINLSVPASVDIVLKGLADREEIAVSTKALNLILSALETEEDIVLQDIAEKRDRPSTRYVPHASAWR